MSLLYIRLPSSATAGAGARAEELSCLFALASDAGVIEREGVATLGNLAETVARAQRVVLLLAASDVTLLQVKAPPMSAARLKTALPNLVEEQLVSDPVDSVVVPGGVADGLRTAAVVRRDWLETLVKTVVRLGARRVLALPAQLCLPLQPDAATAAIADQGNDIDVTVRLADQSGVGLPVLTDGADAVQDVLQAVRMLVPAGAVKLYVPQDGVAAFRALADEAMTIAADSWQMWITGARTVTLDMMAGLGASAAPTINWRIWRWPALLAAAVLLINAIALNTEWWRARREADGLRAVMMQTYRSAFPKETVIVDPLAQMRQKIAAAKQGAGQPAPDDFASLAGRFGDAWAQLGRGASVPAIASLEYRDRVLAVKLKEGGDAIRTTAQQALAQRNLSLTATAADTWQIRNGK